MPPVNFNLTTCQSRSSAKIFGICDPPNTSSSPAYLDTKNGQDWIAVVSNEYKFETTFTAIDNCITITRPNGTMAKRCDGMLTYTSDALGQTVIFVELKNRIQKDWIKDAEEQLRELIPYFEDTTLADQFKIKKAYIANKACPKFRETQINRMNDFFEDTKYVLRIENRINLD